jgi:hypothetical protein
MPDGIRYGGLGRLKVITGMFGWRDTGRNEPMGRYLTPAGITKCSQELGRRG